MPPGRKKKCRTLTIDVDALVCHCFGPLMVPEKELYKKEKVFIPSDEFQTIVYQDIDGLTMQQGAEKMGISKTVYAGLYSHARHKLADALLYNKVLHLGCSDKDDLALSITNSNK